MASKFLNLSTDNTLGGASASNEIVPSQKAIKEYVDNQGGGAAIDNSTITKNSSNELQTEAVLNMNSASGATNPLYQWQGTLAEYTAQNIEVLHPDWVCIVTDDSATIAWGDITGSISNQTDLQNALDAKYDASNPNGYQANVIETVKVNGAALTPVSKAVDITIPTVNNATLTITQGGTSKGIFTANASSDVTIALDSGGSSLPTQTGHAGEFLTTDGTDASWATPTATINWGTSTSNISSTRPAVIVESYINGTSWYRVWSDGFCEQGGELVGVSDYTVSFLKQFANTNYLITTGNYDYSSPDDGNYCIVQWRDKTTAGVRFQAAWHGALYATTIDWIACGYIS